eukprot:TRINITY_DN4069_c0_g1_i2.p1 TRINITY_DN4069_c0_g1~~TRINITY_DN4069_c0_g1_i2.p1  ORF type:complete len:374 (+),score=73.21 TRINITY_DN4069_c0_g1_i2:105-1226(+)
MQFSGEFCLGIILLQSRPSVFILASACVRSLFIFICDVVVLSWYMAFSMCRWDSEGGVMDRSRGNKRNWILVWEDGYCDFARMVGKGFPEGESSFAASESFQPELFFKMSHEVYNYGEGLMGKIAADNSHKWIQKAPSENGMLIYPSSWPGSIDPHPRTWEAQFNSGIQTIAVVAVREGLIQLASLEKIVEDLNFVIFLQRKFNYLQSIPGVFAMHPAFTFDLSKSKGLIEHCHHPQKQQQEQQRQQYGSIAVDGNPAASYLKSCNNGTFYGNAYPGGNINRGMDATMQPSMSSLQALLSKLPSVTSAEVPAAAAAAINASKPENSLPESRSNGDGNGCVGAERSGGGGVSACLQNRSSFKFVRGFCDVGRYP